MNISRRDSIAMLVGAAAASAMPAAARAQSLTTVRYGFANKSVSADILNLVIPAYLGYFREEGIQAEFIPLGSSAAVYAEQAAGRVTVGLGIPSFEIPIVARGEQLPAISVFEHTYPFKYGIAVSPGSSITSLRQLKGKRLGVSQFGTSDFPVGKSVIRLAGLDPDKDVSWLVVGEGITAGQALVHGDIDALVYYDTGFGLIEAAGIPLRYLPLPADVPKVGGAFITATHDVLAKQRNAVVGFARAVAKAETFIIENPAAAAYAFIQLYPEAAPQGVSIAQQIKTIEIPLARRARLYRCYDRSVRELGFILRSEWSAEVRFAGAQSQIHDPQMFFTNDLIHDINNFDAGAIRKQARGYKVPTRT